MSNKTSRDKQAYITCICTYAHNYMDRQSMVYTFCLLSAGSCYQHHRHRCVNRQTSDSTHSILYLDSWTPLCIWLLPSASFTVSVSLCLNLFICTRNACLVLLRLPVLYVLSVYMSLCLSSIFRFCLDGNADEYTLALAEHTVICKTQFL